MAGTKKKGIENPYEVCLGMGADAETRAVMRLDQALELWKGLAHAVRESNVPVAFRLRVRGPGGALCLRVTPDGERDAALCDLDRNAMQAIEREYPAAVTDWWRKRIAAGADGQSVELDLVDAFAGRKGRTPDGNVLPALSDPQNSARLKKIVRLFRNYVGWESSVALSPQEIEA